jgi:hypothetical protein
MKFTKPFERGHVRSSEHGVRDSSSEGEFINGRSHGGHDALSAGTIEVLRFEVTATEIYHLQMTCDRRGLPLWVTQMSVLDLEFPESGNTEERRKGELGAKNGMRFDIVVTYDEGDIWVYVS